MSLETFLDTLYRPPRDVFDETNAHALAADAYAIERANESARRNSFAREAHEMATIGD